MQRTLVRLVEHHRRVRRQVRLPEEFAQQHAVGHILESGAIGCAVFEADRVAHLVAQLDAHLVRHALGH